MLYPGPARLRSTDALVDFLDHAATAAARDVRQRLKAKRPRRGATLRPGIETPHWLALVDTVRPLLRRRGTKALLARELGLHRGRVTQFFETKSAMPDAERTLLLLIWLRRQASLAET